MSMLDRYRKPGGFVQLLALIETCSQTKQEKLLEVISQEDLRWSETVRAKMLSIDRIYAWDDHTLAEVFGTLQDLTVAVALHSAPVDFKKRITGFFSQGRVRKIDDLVGSMGPTPAEVAAIHMKIIESVRKMGSDGVLRFDAIDPKLVITDGIDADLATPPIPGHPAPLKVINRPTAAEPQTGNSRVLHSYSRLVEHVAAKAEPVVDASGKSSSTNPSNQTSVETAESRLMEIQTLKRRVAEMSKENAVLRHELSIVRAKLDQIKKIA